MDGLWNSHNEWIGNFPEIIPVNAIALLSISKDFISGIMCLFDSQTAKIWKKFVMDKYDELSDFIWKIEWNILGILNNLIPNENFCGPNWDIYKGDYADDKWKGFCVKKIDRKIYFKNNEKYSLFNQKSY